MYKINTYRKVEGKKNLKGYVDVYDCDKKWLISGCSIFANGGKYWVNMPSRSYKNENGETRYSNIVQMHKEDQDKFSAEVMKALKGFDPKAPKSFEIKKEEPEAAQGENDFPF